MAVRRVLAIIVVAAIAVLVPATAASANTPPNVYTPVGVSWVDVPVGERVYFENFGSDYDDWAIYYVPAGITCTSSSIVATGPFLTARDLDETDCLDGASAPVDPIDDATRAGATPFGFPVNFFGTTYTSAWPNTNGGIFFDAPDSDYDETLAILADGSGSSAMFPLGADIYYERGQSNFWMAQTTVDGLPAVVFSWETFRNCCSTGPSTEDMSFQLVLMDVGSGDFDAWFNYDSLNEFDQGYSAATALIDLRAGVTVGSNVLVARDVSNVPTVCTEGYIDELGAPTDTTFIDDLNNGYWFKVDNTSARTISVWSDSACSAPITVNVLQDEATDLVAYIQLVDDTATSFDAIATGWSTYRPSTGAIDATELLFNVDATELTNDAANPLITRSLNTTVPGRFVIGQRDGGTVGDPAVVAAASTPALAATGSPNLAGVVILGGALLLAGCALVGQRKKFFGQVHPNTP